MEEMNDGSSYDVVHIPVKVFVLLCLGEGVNDSFIFLYTRLNINMCIWKCRECFL